MSESISSQPHVPGAITMARFSFAAVVIGWALALCYYSPGSGTVEGKVLADAIRGILYFAGFILAIVPLLEVLRHGTGGILLYSVVGLVGNGAGIYFFTRDFPIEFKLHRAGTAIRRHHEVVSHMAFQDLANPNLLRDQDQLRARHQELQEFLATSQKTLNALHGAQEVFLSNPGTPGPEQAKVALVARDLNTEVERVRREIELATAADHIVQFLDQEWGNWKMEPDHRDPTFNHSFEKENYDKLMAEMLPAEYALAGQQQAQQGYATFNPGERTVSVTIVHGRSANAPAPSAPAARPAGEVPVLINYTNLNFQKLEDIRVPASAGQKLYPEDTAVLQAWSRVFTNLVAVRNEVLRTRKALGDADILNENTINPNGPVPVSQQFANRRGVANEYGRAINSWKQLLFTFSNRYLSELIIAGVPQKRAQIEQARLEEATRDRIKDLEKICAADYEIASHYNYATSALETYYSTRNGSYAQEFANQVTALNQLKSAAWQLRQQLKSD